MQAHARVQLTDRVALLRRATEISPADAGGWRALSDALVRTGRYPEAGEVLPKSAELGRDTARELINTIARLHRVDPEAIIAGTDEHEVNRWLLLKALVGDDEARDIVRPLDTPDRAVKPGLLFVHPLLWRR